MEDRDRLVETYEYLDKLLETLKAGKKFDAEIGQAANDFSLHLRQVQASSLGQRETVRGMRELKEYDTVVELQSKAAMLLGVLRPYLYPTGSFMPGLEPSDLTD